MNKRGRKPEERIKQIPLDMINEPKFTARTSMSDEKMQSLQRSIKQIGVLNPILVIAKNDGRYEITAGHRRYLASAIIHEATIPARVMDGDNLTGELSKLHENVEREDLTVLDEARSYAHLIKIYKLSQSELAEKAGKSEAYVSQRLAILEAPELIRDALDDSVITFSVARELAKIHDDAELQRLLLFAVNNGITPAVARSWRLTWEAGQELNKDKVDGVVIVPAEKSTYEPGKFGCDACSRPTSVNEMKIIRCCPGCEQTIKSA